MFRFIEAEKANHAVSTMCWVLEVSRSGYYAWSSRPPSERAVANAALIGEIRRVHAESDGTYGSRRVHAELRRDGHRVNLKRVERLMRVERIQGAYVPAKRRRAGGEGVLGVDGVRVWPDLVKRDFLSGLRDRSWRVLGLAAAAVRGDDVESREFCCGRRPVVASDDVQTEIEARRDPCRGQYLAVVDVEDVRHDVDVREVGGERGRCLPMGRRAMTVEDTGVSKRERADADRHHPRTACYRSGEGIENPGCWWRGPGAVSRDDHAVGLCEPIESAVEGDREPVAGGDLPRGSTG